MAYVTTSGNQFRLNSSRFRFVGVNNPYLIKSEYTTAQLDTFFACCVADGITVVRTFAYGTQGNSAGNFRYITGTTLSWREAAFTSLDRVLDSARRYGVKIVLTLTDEFNYGPDKDNYCTWNNAINGTSYTHDEFHTDANIITTFKQFINQLASRVNTINGLVYSSDDTIMSWALGNELRYTSGTDSNGSTTNSTRVGVMRTWITSIATYIKSVAPRQLCNISGQMQYYDFVNGDTYHNSSFYGQDYLGGATNANIDYFDFHFYPWTTNANGGFNKMGQAYGAPNAKSKNGMVFQIDRFIYDAKTTGNKPVVMEEFSIHKQTTDNDTSANYPRWIGTSEIMKYFFDRGGDGFMFWSYSNLSDDTSFTIKPDGVHTGSNANSNLNDDDTPLRSVIAMNSYHIMGKRIPVSQVAGSAIL